MVKNVIAGVVVALFMMSFAIAGTTDKTMFNQFDTDGDGYISKQEASQREDLQKNWEQADKDNDNKLDVSEFSAFESREMFQPAEVEEPEPGAAPTR